MRAKTAKRSVLAVVVSIILLVWARGASAQQTGPSITTNDGSVLTNVKVLKTEGGAALLNYADADGVGASWFPLDSMSADARKSLGLPPSEEQASYESVLWDVAQWAAEKAQASRDEELREEHWRQEALASLPESSHKVVQASGSLAVPSPQVTFVAADGYPVAMDSSSLTPEQRTLYVTQYVQEQAASWLVQVDNREVRIRHWREEAFRRREREEHWRDEALRGLDGPGHEVSFIGPDGKRITKDSSRLTPEERRLYIRQFVEGARVEHWRGEAFAQRTREERWRDEAAKQLDGPHHRVKFIGPAGRLTWKDSGNLTHEERQHFLRQYAEAQQINEWRHQPRTITTGNTTTQTATPQQQLTGRTPTQQQPTIRRPAVQQQPATFRQPPVPVQQAQPNMAYINQLRSQARAGNKNAQATLKSMGQGW